MRMVQSIYWEPRDLAGVIKPGVFRLKGDVATLVLTRAGEKQWRAEVHFKDKKKQTISNGFNTRRLAADWALDNGGFGYSRARVLSFGNYAGTVEYLDKRASAVKP